MNFYIILGDFLDEFYRSGNEKRVDMLQNIPPIEDNWLPLFAATVHKLANDYNLNVPDWVWQEKCYSKEPFYDCNARGNLRLLFNFISPTEFKHRNLFVDENFLRRV